MVQFLIGLITGGDDEGQGLAEYALILGLIAVVVIGAVILLGGNINTIMNDVANRI